MQPKPTVEVGGTYRLADKAQAKISHFTTGIFNKRKVFYASVTTPGHSWYEDGTHTSGKQDKNIIERVDPLNAGSLVITTVVDTATMTATSSVARL